MIYLYINNAYEKHSIKLSSHFPTVVTIGMTMTQIKATATNAMITFILQFRQYISRSTIAALVSNINALSKHNPNNVPFKLSAFLYKVYKFTVLFISFRVLSVISVLIYLSFYTYLTQDLIGLGYPIQILYSLIFLTYLSHLLFAMQS